MREASITLKNVEALRRSTDEYRTMIQAGLKKVRARQRRNGG